MTKYDQATNVGLVRKQNEDSIAVIEPDTAAGEVASRMLIETVRNELNSISLPWNEDILSAAISKANENILSEATHHSEYEGMGTTATILHIAQPGESQPQIITQRAFYAHVGDSRLYKLENDHLRQITRDHSYVEDLVLKGELTEEQARIHPMKNVLTQAVGAMPEINIDVGSFKVKSGEIYLLCTDGLTNMVDNEEIAALSHGGKDNVSVIVVGIL